MTSIDVLLAVVRPYSSNSLAVAIGDASRERMGDYQALRRNQAWQSLTDACLSDLQHADGHAQTLLDTIHSLGAVRFAAARSRTAIRRRVDAIDIAKADGVPAATAAAAEHHLAQIRAFVHDQALFPANYGRFVLVAAHAVLCAQCAAIEGLIEAGLNATSRHAALADRSAASFWDKPQPTELATPLSAWRRSLTQRLHRIYVGGMTNRAGLPDELRALSRWAVPTFRDAIAAQAAINHLLRHERRHADPAAHAAVSALAIEAGQLIKDIAASHIAALMALLGLDRICLTADAADIVAPSLLVRMPFDGGWDRGKRAAIDRIATLSEGMRVSVRGVLASAAFADNRFIATLKDFAGPATAQIAAGCDLLARGLGEGCHVRATGTIRPARSGMERHLEIETLDLRAAAADSWKAQFLNLASPYFEVWPDRQHIAFQLVADRGHGLRGGGVPRSLGLCAAQRADRDAKQQALSDAQEHLGETTVALTAATLALWEGCLAGPFTLGISCVAALAAYAAAAIAEHEAWNQVDAAQQALDEAQQQLNDCLHPTSGGLDPNFGADLAIDWDGGDDGGSVTPPPPPVSFSITSNSVVSGSVAA